MTAPAPSNLRAPAAPLASIEVYDPHYHPAETLLSANENPRDVDKELRRMLSQKLRTIPFNRYPDPLCTELRERIAEANGLEPGSVLIGNGGDELLFNLALCWGGPGRTMLNLPPTFSVYAHNAELLQTRIVEVARRDDFEIDEEAVLARVAEGDIDYIIIASPNNPTGTLAREEFVLHLAESCDALIMVDEAYFEFSRRTLRPYLATHPNIVLLRTFSKAFALAGVRVGYLLGDPYVIDQFIKVRQPYSVDVLSQAIAAFIFDNRARFERGIDAVIEERGRLARALATLPGVTVFPSDANYLLFRVAGAHELWEALQDQGILIRDFSSSPELKDCLRVTVGLPEENNRFFAAAQGWILAKERR